MGHNVRVVAGSHRGRRLAAPQGRATRPTPDRVREAVFNMLYSLGGMAGAKVVDLYAGTGAMGIEALSRGADHALFVETSPEALAALRENLLTVGLEDRAEIVSRDVESFLRSSSTRFDLAIIDPPYAFDDWSELLAEVSAGLVVIESGRDIDLPSGWETHRVKRYGGTVVTVASPHRSGADNAGSASS